MIKCCDNCEYWEGDNVHGEQPCPFGEDEPIPNHWDTAKEFCSKWVEKEEMPIYPRIKEIVEGFGANTTESRYITDTVVACFKRRIKESILRYERKHAEIDGCSMFIDKDVRKVFLWALE